MYGVNVNTHGAGSFCSRGVYTVAFNSTPSRSGIFTPHWNLTLAGSGGGTGASASAADTMTADSSSGTSDFTFMAFLVLVGRRRIVSAVDAEAERRDDERADDDAADHAALPEEERRRRQGGYEPRVGKGKIHRALPHHDLGCDQRCQCANRRETQRRLDARGRLETLTSQQQRGASREGREDEAAGHEQHIEGHACLTLFTLHSLF